ncbi:MAG: DUF4384 domain-containing protein, partial [Nitrospirales bacterium]
FASSLMNFGGNLLATAASNYGQKYSGKIEKFLTKLVTPKKKRKRNQQQDTQFSQDQFPTDDQQDFQDESEFDQDSSDQFVDNDGQEFADQEEFDDSQFQGEEDEQGFDEDVDQQFGDQPISRGIGRFPVGQEQEGQDPCTQAQNGQTDNQYDEDQQGGYQDYGQQDDGYDSDQLGQDYDQQGGEDDQQYANDDTQQGYDQQQEDGEPIGLDVALVRKTIRNGAPVILPIKDGELLRDGRGNPQAGDKFRIMFRPNSQAYVYVIAVDGSGWAQGIFPSPTSPFANPVKPEQQYVIPEASNWFSLDQFKGIETIFFIASHEPRKDIEDIFKSIMGKERPASATPQQVTKAAIVPNGYGGSHVSQTPFGFTLASGGQHEIVPTSFLAKTAGEDLRITRWFRHQ